MMISVLDMVENIVGKGENALGPLFREHGSLVFFSRDRCIALSHRTKTKPCGC